MQLKNDFRVGVPPATAWQVFNDVERIAPCLPGAQLQEIEGDEYRGVVKVKVGPITAQYKGKATFVEQDEAGGRVVLKASGRDTGGGGNANATITATMVPDGDGTRVTVVTDLAVTGKLAQFGRGVLADVSTKLLGQFVDCLEHNVLAAPVQASVSELAVASVRASVVNPELWSELAMNVGSKGEDMSAAGPEPAAEPEPVVAPEYAVGPEPAVEEPVAAEPVAEPESAAGPEPAVEPEPADGPESGLEPESVDEPEPAVAAEQVAPTIRRFEGPEVEPVDLLEAARSSVAKRVLPPLAAMAALLLAILAWRRRHGR